MRTIQLNIRSLLPQNLEPLWELARNAWWSWNNDAINLFRRINPEEYEKSGPCPLKFLNTLPSSTWQNLTKDNGFLEQLDFVFKQFKNYLEKGNSSLTTFNPQHLIAYFSMEYGIHESIPLYSGGLGILSGDHLKTASDICLPLVAVGLFYKEGYFKQSLNSEGWQQETYELNDPFYLPMQLVTDEKNKPILVDMQITNEKIFLQVWKMNIGRVSLYLLDTHIPENKPEFQAITTHLYASGQEIRIQQEMVLGIGGIKALEKLNLKPALYHLNEGHSAFLTLERLNQYVKDGFTWQEALLCIKGTQIFTIHTPVPAGNDAFQMQMLSRFMGDIYKNYQIPDEEFYNLGRQPENHSEFSMPVFALKTSGYRNGVSQLHKEVSQNIWQQLWSNLNTNEVPIQGITNGVHTRTWICNEFVELFEFYLGKGWDCNLHSNDTEFWKRIENIPNSELWNVHLLRKTKLLSSIPKSTMNSETLTIGFARRFASYKRGHLIFSDIERLKKILYNKERPVQLLISGKSHPADNAGKEIIHKIIQSIQKENLHLNIIFLENYDMHVAQRLVRGVDLWLNTPIRPLEASGTSGMKVAINGGLNLSILDGWWDEAYDPALGWCIGDHNTDKDETTRDKHDAEKLYSILENEIIPLYYQSRVPDEWIKKMKKSMSILIPQFSAQRMLFEYVSKSYEKASEFYKKFMEGDTKKILTHLNALDTLQKRWNEVDITHVELKPSHTVNVDEPVTLQVELSSPFAKDWLEISLLQTCKEDPYAHDQEVLLSFSEDGPDPAGKGDKFLFAIQIETHNPEIRNYTLRVAPNRVLFPEHLDLNLVQRSGLIQVCETPRFVNC